MVGYCEHHEEHVDWNKFEWKGCWSCHYFRQDEDFPYVDVYEAADILSVSRSTVVRWIKNKKVVGLLLERGRKLSFLSPPHKKYFVQLASLEEFYKEGELIMKADDVLENLREYCDFCPTCQHLMELHYEYQTEKFGIESGIMPLQNIVLSCENCGVVLKKEVNGFIVVGDVIDFDRDTITIRPVISPQGGIELTGNIILGHSLDLSNLKWFKDNLELVEGLVIDNKLIKISS